MATPRTRDPLRQRMRRPLSPRERNQTRPADSLAYHRLTQGHDKNNSKPASKARTLPPIRQQKATAEKDNGVSAIPRMRTPDFHNSTKLPEFDCEIKAFRGRTLFCHKAILSMWSPTFAELFESEEYTSSEIAVISLPDERVEDLQNLLAVIYPPNRPVNDASVMVLLKLAKKYQMQEVTLRCERFLLQRKCSLDMLLVAQEFNLDSLMNKNVHHLRNIPLNSLEKHRRFPELESAILLKILMERLKLLERNNPTSKSRNTKVLTRLGEFLKLFSDIRLAWTAKSSNGMKHRDFTFARAEVAMDILRDKDSQVPHPYTRPEEVYTARVKSNPSKREDMSKDKVAASSENFNPLKSKKDETDQGDKPEAQKTNSDDEQQDEINQKSDSEHSDGEDNDDDDDSSSSSSSSSDSSDDESDNKSKKDSDYKEDEQDIKKDNDDDGDQDSCRNDGAGKTDGGISKKDDVTEEDQDKSKKDGDGKNVGRKSKKDSDENENVLENKRDSGKEEGQDKTKKNGDGTKDVQRKSKKDSDVDKNEGESKTDSDDESDE